MARLRFAQFSGEIPRLASRLLPDTSGQIAENVRLEDGTLTPIRKPRAEFVITGLTEAVQTIYLHNGEWLHWSNVVNAVPGPVATDRLYYTGDGTPKMRVGSTIYELALGYPTAALTGSITEADTSRQYGYTYVDSSGTESKIGALTTAVSWNSNRNVTLNNLEAVPTGASIVKQRFYYNVGSNYYLISERAASQASFIDTGLAGTLATPPATSTLAEPKVAPTATIVKKEVSVTRLYVYTWVTQFGEESEPCPASNEITWEPGKTVTLTGFVLPPTGRGITKQRIYRSQSSSQNGTGLFLIEERDATVTADYVDTHSQSDFSDPLPSASYNQPPADLAGLIALPNGMLAGFSGKQLCFCEPFKPHAWPEKYRITVSYEIVALGAFGTTVVAGTTGTPSIFSGSAPENMVQEKTEINLPCVNARSMVDLGYSVAYASHDGLVVVSSSGPSLATNGLFTRQNWDRLSPASCISGQFAGRYFMSYSYNEVDGTTTNGMRIIDLTGSQPFSMRSSYHPTAFYYDLPTGKLYYLVDDTIYEWDALGQTNEIMTYTTKRVVLDEPVSFSAILAEKGRSLTVDEQYAFDQLIATIQEANDIIFAANMDAEINGEAINESAFLDDGLQLVAEINYLAIKIFAGGKLIKTVYSLDEIKRIPPVRSREWELEIIGTAVIDQITLATSSRELAG